MMKRLNSIYIFLIASLTVFSYLPPAYSFCFEEAGDTYNINSDLLKAIAYIESNYQPHAVNRRNKNGSYDFGLMQINSSWAGKIGHELWMELGDPCQNVMVGAWILAGCIKRHGYTWEAVGCYNTPNQKKQVKYITKVRNALREMSIKD